MAAPLDDEAKDLLTLLGTEVGAPSLEDVIESRSGRPDRQLAGDPEPTAVCTDIVLPLEAAAVRARIYRARSGGPQPILVWLHGGGFCGGSLDGIDSVCAAIARRAPVTVLSLEYRLAPEHPFPAALDDTYGTLDWVVRHGAAIGGDGRVVVGGQSAGGNLAAASCLLARERGGPAPLGQILCYPELDAGFESESHRLFDGLLWDRACLEWCHDQYLPDGKSTPLAAPLLAESLAGLPSALILTAGHDPYRDDGRRYARRLIEADVATTHIEYPGTIHAFLNFPGVLRSAWRAIDDISAYLRQLLPDASGTSLQHTTTLYDEKLTDALHDFYATVLGLREKDVPPVFAGTGIVWFAAGDGERELHFVPRDFPGGEPHTCLEVDDVDAIADALTERGISYVRSDDIADRPRLFCRDPFGNLVEVFTFSRTH